MHTSRKRPTPPWQRTSQDPVHPVGRARRRFPAAEAAPQLPARYRRSFDGAGDPRIDGTSTDQRVSGGVLLPRRRGGSAYERVRGSRAVKYGVMGLGVVGTATPLAIARANDMRTDPSHERQLSVIPQIAAPKVLNDGAVGQAWREARLEVADKQVNARDQVIEQKLEAFKSYNVSRELAEDIYDIALEEDIDPDIAFGLVRTESSFKNAATSHVGAIGLTQLMPATARWLKKDVTIRDLRDSRTNLRIGFKYLNDLIKKYDGDTKLALLAYNRGPGTVDRVLKRGGDPDNGYPDMVLKGQGSH